MSAAPATGSPWEVLGIQLLVTVFQNAGPAPAGAPTTLTADITSLYVGQAAKFTLLKDVRHDDDTDFQKLITDAVGGNIATFDATKMLFVKKDPGPVATTFVVMQGNPGGDLGTAQVVGTALWQTAQNVLDNDDLIDTIGHEMMHARIGFALGGVDIGTLLTPADQAAATLETTVFNEVYNGAMKAGATQRQAEKTAVKVVGALDEVIVHAARFTDQFGAKSNASWFAVRNYIEPFQEYWVEVLSLLKRGVPIEGMPGKTYSITTTRASIISQLTTIFNALPSQMAKIKAPGKDREIDLTKEPIRADVLQIPK